MESKHYGSNFIIYVLVKDKELRLTDRPTNFEYFVNSIELQRHSTRIDVDLINCQQPLSEYII